MSQAQGGRSREAGFSLVEVLAAVAILGIVALGIVGLFSHSIVVNASGYDYAVLSGVARQALEQLQALPFEDAALVAGNHTLVDPTGTDRFTVTYAVTDFRVSEWSDVSAPVGSTPPDPSAWPVPGVEAANLKRITLGVASESQNLFGNRQFVATALKAP